MPLDATVSSTVQTLYVYSVVHSANTLCIQYMNSVFPWVKMRSQTQQYFLTKKQKRQHPHGAIVSSIIQILYIYSVVQSIISLCLQYLYNIFLIPYLLKYSIIGIGKRIKNTSNSFLCR
jgi:hypothetical protein